MIVYSNLNPVSFSKIVQSPGMMVGGGDEKPDRVVSGLGPADSGQPGEDRRRARDDRAARRALDEIAARQMEIVMLAIFHDDLPCPIQIW